jgi:6-phosphogluconolactonase/glucosamine-6-phosphate isomerase/deaminase
MTEHYFETRLEASTAAADRIALLLAKRLDNNGDASVIVSGGSSPRQCMAALAEAPLDWRRVQVALSDERWVPPDHEDSNEKLVRESLLVGPAASATLLPVFAEGVSPEDRCEQLQDPLPTGSERGQRPPVFAHNDFGKPASPRQHDPGGNFAQ